MKTIDIKEVDFRTFFLNHTSNMLII